MRKAISSERAREVVAGLPSFNDSPAQVMEEAPPELTDTEALKEWHWKRCWAVAQTAFREGRYREVLMAEKQMIDLDLGQAERPDPLLIAPSAREPSKRGRPRNSHIDDETLPDPEEAAAKGAEILKRFQGESYRQTIDEK